MAESRIRNQDSKINLNQLLQEKLEKANPRNKLELFEIKQSLKWYEQRKRK